MDTIKPYFNSDENTFTDSYGTRMKHIHPQTEDCTRRGCVVHCPSDHHMKDWPLLARYRWGGLFMERICEHGVGHPDPDHMSWYNQAYGPKAASYEEVHGCCGCCSVPGSSSTV